MKPCMDFILNPTILENEPLNFEQRLSFSTFVDSSLTSVPTDVGHVIEKEILEALHSQHRQASQGITQDLLD